MTEDAYDPGEFVALGQKIVELGKQLQDLRTERDEAVTKIVELESKLKPIMIRYTEVVFMMSGVPAPAPLLPDSPSEAPQPSAPKSTPLTPDGKAMRNRLRIQKKIDRCVATWDTGEGPPTAASIANRISEDANIVREIIRVTAAVEGSDDESSSE